MTHGNLTPLASEHNNTTKYSC